MDLREKKYGFIGQSIYNEKVWMRRECFPIILLGGKINLSSFGFWDDHPF